MSDTSTIIIRGDVPDAKAQVYHLATDYNPINLLTNHGFNFEVAAESVASSLGVSQISYNGAVSAPYNWILAYLCSCYEAAVLKRLQALGVAVANDASRGMDAFLRPNSASGGQICKLVSESISRFYDPGALFIRLHSLANVDTISIWSQLEDCELNR